MGGNGAKSSSAAMIASGGGVHELNDSQLDSEIANTRTTLNQMGERLEELAHQIEEARMSPREGRTERIESAQSAYNEGSDLFNLLRDRLNELQDERDARRRSSESPSRRTFVNSYGEATTRYVTSQSYENSQRRLQRRIDSWMKGR